MKKRISLLIVCLACIAALPATTSTALAKTDLCEFGCGGKWGAYEHAKHDAEVQLGETAYVSSCKNTGKNKSGETQWICQGWTYNWNWEVWLDPYGYELYFHAVR
ncbi:MAG: hypothetical protein WA484_16185 [Solirubrobacteraceae bacterium]